jgi:hypothetical protein
MKIFSRQVRKENGDIPKAGKKDTGKGHSTKQRKKRLAMEKKKLDRPKQL